MADKVQVTLQEAVEERICKGHKAGKGIRKDAVKALGIILSGSHERMRAIEDDKQLFEEGKQKNYRFMCSAFGVKNLVRFTIHRDEKTPHIHCVVVPLTKMAGLSAKDLMGGKMILQGYQDRYSQAIACFDLHRSIARELKGILCSTIKYCLNRDGQSKHYFQKGLPRGVAIFAEEDY